MEVLRVVRVFRIVVLAGKIPSLVALIDIFIRCVRSSFAVILLTMLTVYIFSIVGMNMFGSYPTDEVLLKVRIPQDTWKDLRNSDTLITTVCPSCESYNDHTNFNSFTASFKLLMQVAFGQELSGFVKEMSFLGAGFWTTFAYFASFYMLTVWVLINLLIVTVLANFELANTSLHPNSVSTDDIDGVAHTWAALTIGVHQVKAAQASTARACMCATRA